MSEHAISRFPVPELDEMPEDIRQMIEAVQEKSGFVPNVFLALAYRPDEFRAFFAAHDALMDKSEGLSKAEREMIVVATSAVNDCLYCVVAHGAILRIRAKNPLIADQVAINPWKADLSERERHMVDCALKMVNDSASVTDAEGDLDLRCRARIEVVLAGDTAVDVEMKVGEVQLSGTSGAISVSLGTGSVTGISMSSAIRDSAPTRHGE